MEVKLEGRFEVHRSGYHWVERDHQRRSQSVPRDLFGQPPLEWAVHDLIEPINVKLGAEIKDLSEFPTLFLDATQLHTKDEIIDFANVYGWGLSGVIFGMCTFKDWKEETANLRNAIELWRCLCNRDLETLGEYFEYDDDGKLIAHRLGDYLNSRLPYGKFSKGDLLTPAHEAISLITREIRFDEVQFATGSVTLKPRSLRDFLFAQFVMARANDTRFAKCQSCGKYMLLSGKRVKQFCSGRCRVRGHRNDKTEVNIETNPKKKATTRAKKKTRTRRK